MGKALVILGADFSQVAVDTIEITVVAPTISISEQGVVTLSNEDNYDMYYTTDGSTPTTSSTKYTAPFTVADGVTVKAITAFGSNVSSVSSSQYVAPVVVPEGYTALDYISGIATPITLSESFTGTTWEFDVVCDSATTANGYILFTGSTGGQHFSACSNGKWGLGATKATNIAVTTRVTAVVSVQSTAITLTIGNTTVTGAAPGSSKNLFGYGTVFYPGRVYSVKCISGGNGFNGIPVKRNTDNAKGIYDLTNDVFYATGGTAS